MTGPLINPDGTPIARVPAQPRRHRGEVGRPRPNALHGSGNAAYDAADIYGQHLGGWRPYLWSPDGQMNMYRDIVVARARDVALNDGWASGLLTTLLDSAIGATFRPIAKPHWQALARQSGAAFDAQWAREYATWARSVWAHWADDEHKWCDVTRNQTFTQMSYLGFRHYLIDGDTLGMVHWLPDRVGYGAARYATALQMIDPDRLSNPQLRFDDATMRGGVVIDGFGAATGYHIRRAHPGDWWAQGKSMQWDLVPRATPWGRPIIVHFFDHERAGQHRGGAGILTPILQRLKMLIKYDGTELDAAIVNAIFAAYIESPFDHGMAEAMMGEEDTLGRYQEDRLDFHRARGVKLNGVQMPTLYPGEKINFVNAARPTSNFAEFESAVLRNVAAGVGSSYEQISRDYSKTNYSSSRAADISVMRTLDRRRKNFASGFGQQVRGAVLEEAHEIDRPPLPTGAPEFAECRQAYCRAEWFGPAAGWVDPVKEMQAAILRIEGGLSTYEIEAARQGIDWEDIAEQHAAEIAWRVSLGLPQPNADKIAASYVADPEKEAGGSP